MKKVFKFGCLGFIGLIVLGIIIAVASGGDDTGNTSGTASKKEKPKKEFTINQEVPVGNFAFTVNGVEEKAELSSILGKKTTEGKFVVVDVAVKNNDKKARLMDGEMFRLIGSDGTEYSSDTEADTYVNDDIGFFLKEVNPKMSGKGKVVFELPKEEVSYKLQVSSGLGWSGGEYQTIKLK